MYKVVIKKGKEWWKLRFTILEDAENVAEMADWLGATETEVIDEDAELEA